MQWLRDFNLLLDQTFHADPVVTWMSDHVEIPIFAVAAYLAMVFWGQDFMRDRRAWHLKPLFIVWNLLLSVFSICGAFFAIPYFLSMLNREDGFRFSICNPSFRRGGYHEGAAGFWFICFVNSKFPELIDTFFLVFQKKPVIFLHWYHHVTVLLYCWHGSLVGVSAGYWYLTMNFSVHAIMYSYYFLMSLSPVTRKIVKPIAPFITIIQILQMMVGWAISTLVLFYSWTDPHCADVTHRSNTNLALAMYSSYFILFGKLFFDTHLRSKSNSKSE